MSVSSVLDKRRGDHRFTTVTTAVLSVASLYEGECQEMEQQSEPVSPRSDSQRADIRRYLCDQPHTGCRPQG